MERAIWIHQYDQLGEQSIADIAATLLPRGITKVYAKVADGTDWMGTFDTSPLAVHNQDEWASQVAEYQANGLTVVPWVVVTSGSEAESDLHAQCGLAAGGLLVDFEYHYQGFFAGTVDDARSYFDALIGSGLPWVGVAPDPRQVGREYGPAVLQGVTAVLPQCYWTDFQRPFDEVLAQAMGACAPVGASVEPILPYDSDPGDMQQGVQFCFDAGCQGVSLWKMGVADAAQLDAFAAPATGESPADAPAPPPSPPADAPTSPPATDSTASDGGTAAPPEPTPAPGAGTSDSTGSEPSPPPPDASAPVADEPPAPPPADAPPASPPADPAQEAEDAGKVLQFVRDLIAAHFEKYPPRS